MILTFLSLFLGLVTARPRELDTETPLQIAVRVLESNPVVDGHNDFPYFLRTQSGNVLNGKVDFAANLTGQGAHTDLGKLRKGKVGGQFWVAFVSCDSQFKDATPIFHEQVDVIKRLIAKYQDSMTLVRTTAELKKAFADKKVGSMIGVESGHAISSSMGVLRMFYDLGARYMTLTHSCNTPWADSSVVEDGTEAVQNNGLSDFGKDIVREMNHLGMMVDLSHVSAKTMMDAIDASTAPVIFSHSSARSVTNHSRNVPDDVIKRMPENGGIIMVNFFSCFVVANCTNATLDDVARHVDYIKDVAGVDHVGIGADYDGVLLMPQDLEDVSKYPALFSHLLEAYGWSEEDLAKLASGNLLRVWQAVEVEAEKLQAETDPDERWIPLTAFHDGETSCQTRKLD